MLRSISPSGGSGSKKNSRSLEYLTTAQLALAKAIQEYLPATFSSEMFIGFPIQVLKYSTLLRNESRIVLYNKRYFSTESEIKLHPWFVTGFTDGEGCFSVSIYKNNELEIS